MKLGIGILVCFAGFLLMGCQSQTTTASDNAYYVDFAGNRFVSEDGVTYQFEDSSITIHDLGESTVITASFLEGTVTVSNAGSTIDIEYPDGCTESYIDLNDNPVPSSRSIALGHVHQSSSHVDLSRITVRRFANDVAEPYWTSKRTWLVVVGGVIMIPTGLFVFFPDNVEKWIVLINRPMFEDSVRPTEWNTSTNYIKSLIGFLVGIFFVLYGLLH